MIAWLAPRLGRAVLALAVTVLLLAIGLTALAVHVAGWPYRRLHGPSQRRAVVQAALGVLYATSALVAMMRKAARAGDEL